MADFSALCEGTLISQLATGTTTGVTVQLKKVNELYSTVTWPTGAHEIMLVRQSEDGLLAERVVVASGTTQSNTTGVVTLGTLTRNCSLTDGTDTTGTSATITWPPSTLVYVTWGIRDADQTVFKNEVNTLTGSGAIRSSSTTTPVVRLNSVTTTQRNNMTPGNGDMVYDSTLNQAYKYEGGAWAAIATGTFSDAANATAGKVDLATAAEVAAGTANDATSGAPNVIPVSIVKTSSTGATNGTVPALNASVALDRTIGGLGTVTGGTAYTLIANGTTATGPTQNLASAGTANQVLTSNGAAALPTFQDIKTFMKPVFLSGVTSTTLTNPTSATDFDTHTYTIPANNLITGVIYKFSFATTVTHGTSGTYRVGLELGGTEAAAITLSAATGTAYTIFEGTIMGTAAASASSAVRVHIKASKIDGSPAVVGVAYAAANFATNGDLAITFTARFGTSDGGNTTAGLMSEIWKSSTTAF